MAARRGKESAQFFPQVALNGKADSSHRRSESAEAAVTQRQIEKQTRHRRYQIKNQDAGDTGKIGERNERDLSRESQGNVKPRSSDPRLGSVEQPKRAAQSRDDSDADH